MRARTRALTLVWLFAFGLAALGTGDALSASRHKDIRAHRNNVEDEAQTRFFWRPSDAEVEGVVFSSAERSSRSCGRTHPNGGTRTGCVVLGFSASASEPRRPTTGGSDRCPERRSN